MKKRMGTFYTNCRVENQVDRERAATVRQVLVDTGAEFTWIRARTLRRLGISPEKKEYTFVMANGQEIRRPVGFAILRVGNALTTDEVIFGEPGDLQILGARSLEGMNLRVDARAKRLVAGGPILAAPARTNCRIILAELMKNQWLCHLWFAVAVVALGSATGCIYKSDSSWSGNWGGDFRVTTNLTQHGEVPASLKLADVENRFGELRVTGTESATNQWTWKLTVHARTEELAQQVAAAATCKAEQNGDRWRLVVSLPNSDGRWGFTSDLDVRVPKAAALKAQNRFGHTEVSHLDSTAEVANQNGGVEIQDIGSQVQARTSFATLKVTGAGAATLENQNGEIQAVRIRGPLHAQTSFAPLIATDISGPVEARNQNGRVEVSQATGKVEARTSFAELRIRGIGGDARLDNQNGAINARDIPGSVRASTSFAPLEIEAAGAELIAHNQNGGIRLRATSTALNRLEAKTSFASLEVRLPGSLKPAVQARTSFAEVESDFPVLMKPRGSDAFADVAPGTPRVTLENQNGGIRVVRE